MWKIEFIIFKISRVLRWLMQTNKHLAYSDQLITVVMFHISSQGPFSTQKYLSFILQRNYLGNLSKPTLEFTCWILAELWTRGMSLNFRCCNFNFNWVIATNFYQILFLKLSLDGSTSVSKLSIDTTIASLSSETKKRLACQKRRILLCLLTWRFYFPSLNMHSAASWTWTSYPSEYWLLRELQQHC